MKNIHTKIKKEVVIFLNDNDSMSFMTPVSQCYGIHGKQIERIVAFIFFGKFFVLIFYPFFLVF